MSVWGGGGGGGGEGGKGGGGGVAYNGMCGTLVGKGEGLSGSLLLHFFLSIYTMQWSDVYMM